MSAWPTDIVDAHLNRQDCSMFGHGFVHMTITNCGRNVREEKNGIAFQCSRGGFSAKWSSPP